jgi:hypothetical protein
MSVCLLISITACSVSPELATVMADDTDLVPTPDSTKLNLGRQHRLVRVVIQDAFDLLHASLLFTNAFPDISLAGRFAKEALLRSALKHTPGSARIYQRLLNDKEYMLKILPMVSQMNIHDDSS